MPGWLSVAAVLAVIGVLPVTQCCVQGRPAPSSDLVRVHIANIPSKFNTDFYNQVQGLYNLHVLSPPLILEDPHGQRMGGRPPGSLMWQTNQYGSNALFYHNLQASRLKTTFDNADWVYIPIFTEFLGCFPQMADALAAQLIPDFYDNVATYLPGLGKKPHVIVLPQPEVFHKLQCAWGAGLTHPNYEHIHKHITFLVMELDPVHHTVLSVDAILNSLNRLVIPYPSAVRLGQRGRKIIAAVQKEKLVSTPFYAAISGLRIALASQCLANHTACATTYGVMVGTRQKSWDDNAIGIATGMQQAWFCLQPGGDSYTRRSLFDCMMLGSIPVVFWSNRFWLEAFPYQDVLDPTKFVAFVNATDDDIAANRTNVIAALEAAYPLPKRREMLDEVLRVNHLFQWAHYPHHDKVSINASATIDCEDDAFTFILKSLQRKFCRAGSLPAARCPPAAQSADGGR